MTALVIDESLGLFGTPFIKSRIISWNQEDNIQYIADGNCGSTGNEFITEQSLLTCTWLTSNPTSTVTLGITTKPSIGVNNSINKCMILLSLLFFI